MGGPRLQATVALLSVAVAFEQVARCRGYALGAHPAQARMMVVGLLLMEATHLSRGMRRDDDEREPLCGALQCPRRARSL